MPLEEERALLKTLNDQEISDKIRRGNAWLRLHSKEMCVKITMWVFDNDRWNYNLSFYQALVDEAMNRGLVEEDCWKSNKELVVGDLTVEELLMLVIDLKGGEMNDR